MASKPINFRDTLQAYSQLATSWNYRSKLDQPRQVYHRATGKLLRTITHDKTKQLQHPHRTCMEVLLTHYSGQARKVLRLNGAPSDLLCLRTSNPAIAKTWERLTGKAVSERQVERILQRLESAGIIAGRYMVVTGKDGRRLRMRATGTNTAFEVYFRPAMIKWNSQAFTGRTTVPVLPELDSVGGTEYQLWENPPDVHPELSTPEILAALHSEGQDVELLSSAFTGIKELTSKVETETDTTSSETLQTGESVPVSVSLTQPETSLLDTPAASEKLSKKDIPGRVRAAATRHLAERGKDLSDLGYDALKVSEKIKRPGLKRTAGPDSQSRSGTSLISEAGHPEHAVHDQPGESLTVSKPGRRKTHDSPGLDRLMLYVELLWSYAYASFWSKLKFMSPSQMLTAQMHFLNELCKGDDIEKRYRELTTTLILVAQWRSRDPERYVPLPSVWFDPAFEKGFHTAATVWLDAHRHRCKLYEDYKARFDAKKSLFGLVHKEMHDYVREPGFNAYRLTAKRLAKLSPDALNTFNAFVLKHPKLAA